MKRSFVLVIDDERGVRDAFVMALEDERGIRVQAVGDGLSGLEAARDTPPDLVFLDLRMPGVDGVETLRRLRAQGVKAPIYVVTAFAREFLAPLQVAAEEGIPFELATKPLSGAQIRELTAAALGRPPHTAEDTGTEVTDTDTTDTDAGSN